MGAPRISVVVVTCDRTRLLVDALGSVGDQDMRPLEVVIADDGGQPGIFEAGARILTLGLQVRLLRPACGQAGAARNAAAAVARGDVLAFLDDDDLWRPDHLAGLADAFEDPATAFAWRDCEVVREEVDAAGFRRDLDSLTIARDWDDARMRDNDYLPPSAWGVRRTFFTELGGFDESFRYSEDWDFALRAAARTTPRRVPGVTVEVRLRESGNASGDFGPERLACLEKLAARHGLPPLEPRTFWEVAQAMGGA